MLLICYCTLPLRWSGLRLLSIFYGYLIFVPTLPLWWFGLCFCSILFLFSYKDYCTHNYYAPTMNTFESEYPFGNFLEASKFDELSEFLQSHYQKNNAVNTIDEGKIPMHSLMFWCKWETKSLHTIFRYIFTSLSNDMRCGKTLSHWFFKQSNEVYGGISPNLDNKKTEPDLVNLFLSNICLFKKKTRTQNKV